MFVAKTKALVNCAVIAQLICDFVFAYACRLFSHAAAHFIDAVYFILIGLQHAKVHLEPSLTSDAFFVLSRHMGKPTICLGENKGADQLHSNCEADQRLCFRYSESTIPLLLKSEISSF